MRASLGDSELPMPTHVYTISPSPDSTLAVEISRSGLQKRKHLFVFEQYIGELAYDPDQPLNSRLKLSIEADSLSVRGAQVKKRTRKQLTRFAVTQVLRPQDHPALRIESQRFTAKPLRGFILAGVLHFRGIDRSFKANIGFGVEKNGRLQIDADATLRLSELNLPRPSSLFGLIRTQDEIVLHALIWGLHSSQG